MPKSKRDGGREGETILITVNAYTQQTQVRVCGCVCVCLVLATQTEIKVININFINLLLHQATDRDRDSDSDNKTNKHTHTHRQTDRPHNSTQYAHIVYRISHIYIDWRLTRSSEAAAIKNACDNQANSICRENAKRQSTANIYCALPDRDGAFSIDLNDRQR